MAAIVVSSISAFFTALGLYVNKQRRDIMNAQRQDQAFMNLYMYLQNEDLREARAKLLGFSSGEASKVLSSFQVAARFVEVGLVSKQIVKEFYGDTILRCFDAAPRELQDYKPWHSLRSLVVELREEKRTTDN